MVPNPADAEQTMAILGENGLDFAEMYQIAATSPVNERPFSPTMQGQGDKGERL